MSKPNYNVESLGFRMDEDLDQFIYLFYLVGVLNRI